jgi:penicillin-binding protein 1A
MSSAYAVFANGGYRVKPYFITKITDDKGGVLFEAKPEQAGENAERVLDPRNAFIMTTLMRDVVRYGTGARAMSLGRHDLAGKTGTTNDHIDAWFAGFQPNLVAIAWIGFDNPTDMGSNETGSQAALPIWMAYMAKALKGVREAELDPPEGVVTVAIDPNTGLRDTTAAAKEALREYFYMESLPALSDSQTAARDKGRPTEEVKNQIF